MNISKHSGLIREWKPHVKPVMRNLNRDGLTWTFFPTPFSRSNSRSPSTPDWRYGTSASVSGRRRARSAPWPAVRRETVPPNPRSGRSRRSWSLVLCWPAASRRGTRPRSDPYFVCKCQINRSSMLARLELDLGAIQRIPIDSNRLQALDAPAPHVLFSDSRYGKSKKAGTRGRGRRHVFPPLVALRMIESVGRALSFSRKKNVAKTFYIFFFTRFHN